MKRLVLRILTSMVLWIGAILLAGVLLGYAKLAHERSGTYRGMTPAEARTISIVLFLMGGGVLAGAVKTSFVIWTTPPGELWGD